MLNTRLLNLKFNHTREALGQKPNLPIALEQKLIGRPALTVRANGRHKNLQGFEDNALDWLIATDLNADRRRDLLQRLRRPDYANLPKLIVADLNHQYSRGFGLMAIHRNLLLGQLDQCF